MVASLLFVGCSGSVGTVAPQPSVSPAPPTGTARGSLAVAMIGREGDTNESRIRIFPPHSDEFIRERVIHSSQFQPNSLAFDRRGHLYAGYNDTSGGGRYEVDDIDIQRWALARTIRVPRWSHSSVATDDHDNLYVNTKAFIGGDINIFRNNTETKPYIEIKDHHSPMTMLVGRDALWVGYEGAFSDALARYRLRSTNRTWFQTIGRNVPLALTVNTEGSLIAALVRRKSGRAVDVIDVASGKLARTLLAGNLGAMTTDQSGHIYVSETSGGPGTSAKVYTCDFLACTNSFETNSSRVVALAVSPLDGMLYVANSGKTRVDVYNPRTAKLVMTIWLTHFELKALAIEP
jgi:hypothetical protein